MDPSDLSIIILALYEAIPIWEQYLNGLNKDQEEEHYLLSYQIDKSKELFTRLKEELEISYHDTPNKPIWEDDSN